jgi:hypothetical protein
MDDVAEAVEKAKREAAAAIDTQHRYKDVTPEEKAIVLETTPWTLASIEAKVDLIRAVRYVVENDIPGHFVETGVFQGGNEIIMIRTLQGMGVKDRYIWLYDTFDKFPRPEEIDYEYGVGPALVSWQQANLGITVDIKQIAYWLLETGYPPEKMIYVKGLVEDTLPRQVPPLIALLRLDTDFYRSIKHSLIHLYPLLVDKGVLILDDYGAFHGAKVATDEYFRETGTAFRLHRIDEHVRAGVKRDGGS